MLGRPTPRTSSFKVLKRSVWLLLRTLALLVRLARYGRSDPRRAARRLYDFFERSEGVFTKLGQFLASRYDYLPATYCDALGKLLDRLPPTPVERIKEILERDLGLSLEEAFLHFEDRPLASASIAQVHAATLYDGTAVVVKVKHPNTDATFACDFAAMAVVAGVLRYVPGCGQLATIVAEFRASLSQELDFRREATNIRVFHQILAEDSEKHCAPALVADRCGDDAITMERVFGVALSDYLEIIDRQDDAELARLAAEGIERRSVAEGLLRSFMLQFLHHRVFHGDPHPANVILMKGGWLGYVDLGALGRLDEELWRRQFRLRIAVSQKRVSEALDAILAVLDVRHRQRIDPYRGELKEILTDWFESSSSTTEDLRAKSSSFYFMRVFDILRRAGVPMPAETMKLYRATFVIDILALKVDPTVDWLGVLQGVIKQQLPYATATLVRERTTSRLWEVLASPANDRGSTDVLVRPTAELLKLGRNLLAIFLVFLVLGRWPVQAIWPDSAWGSTVTSMSAWWWALTVLLGYLFFELTRALRRLRY